MDTNSQLWQLVREYVTTAEVLFVHRIFGSVDSLIICALYSVC